MARPASFLAIHSLQQLATDEQLHYHEACGIILTDFYVDDLLTGASELTHLKRRQTYLISTLHKRGFHLRKWTTKTYYTRRSRNSPAIRFWVNPRSKNARFTMAPRTRCGHGQSISARKYEVNWTSHPTRSCKTIQSTGFVKAVYHYQ